MISQFFMKSTVYIIQNKGITIRPTREIDVQLDVTIRQASAA